MLQSELSCLCLKYSRQVISAKIEIVKCSSEPYYGVNLTIVGVCFLKKVVQPLDYTCLVSLLELVKGQRIIGTHSLLDKLFCIVTSRSGLGVVTKAERIL